MVQIDPAPAEFAGKTVAYAEAKVAYFTALRNEMPELINIASGKEPRPLKVAEERERLERRLVSQLEGRQPDGKDITAVTMALNQREDSDIPHETR